MDKQYVRAYQIISVRLPIVDLNVFKTLNVLQILLASILNARALVRGYVELTPNVPSYIIVEFVNVLHIILVTLSDNAFQSHVIITRFNL